MHFEILIEDQSGKKLLDNLIPKIIGKNDTFKVNAYRGIGHLPAKSDLSHINNIRTQTLLNNLPRLINGYANSWQTYKAVLFIVCDLDDKCLVEFKNQLMAVWESCENKPTTRFCIAIEEGEAWLLGDFNAIKSAYPKAKDSVLRSYKNDSICGTWELLADAIYKGGIAALRKKNFPTIGMEKCEWSENISQYMDVNNNLSASFVYFKGKLLELVS